MTQIGSNILISYQGGLTHDKLEDLLLKVKNQLDGLDNELVVKKRVYSVMVECLENTYKHQEFNSLNPKQSEIELVLEKTKNDFKVSISNSIESDQIKPLTKKIDKVNKLNRNELNHFYRTAIADARISEKGGAGLGIIEIARSSRQKIKYSISGNQNSTARIKLQVFIADKIKKYC